MKHIYEKHDDCGPDDICLICDGGLCVCIICGGAEVELTIDCCGRRMSIEEKDDVSCGLLNFKDGKWIRKNKK